MKSTIYLAIVFLICSCAANKHKNISYLPKDTNKGKREPTLNVYEVIDDTIENSPVIIFVGGDNWDNANNKIYDYYGKNFVEKGITVVLPNYNLSPNANIDEMTSQIATAFEWTKENITNYGGDSTNIYLSGHSAGGHLVALAAIDPKYGINPSEVAGIILNDAAGLDMYTTLKKNPPTDVDHYKTTWTEDSLKWKDASPITYINEQTPPMLIFIAKNSYPDLKAANQRFYDKLLVYQPDAQIVEVNTDHSGIMIEYQNYLSEIFDMNIDFIRMDIELGSIK